MSSNMLQVHCVVVDDYCVHLQMINHPHFGDKKVSRMAKDDELEPKLELELQQ